MVKSLFWLALGAAAALQLDRWIEARRRRLSPGALTGSLLERVNSKLERKRAAQDVPV